MAETPAQINPTPIFGGAPIVHVQDFVDNATALGVEEVLVTVPGVRVGADRPKIVLVGHAYATGAVGTTTMTLRIRRTNLAGAIVGEAVAVGLAGAVQEEASIVAEDDQGAGSFDYVLTGTIAGAAATVNGATLDAFVEAA